MRNSSWNYSSWVGFGIAGAVLFFGVFHALPHPGLFLDGHALLLVCGGTLAAALISLRFRKLEDLASMLVFGMLLKRNKPTLHHARELLELSTVSFSYRTILFDFEFTHPFAKEAFELAKKDYLPESELKILMLKRNEYFKRSYQSDAKALHNLGKFPPAFGLLGATTGMIAMMTQLGAGAQDQIGPAMAVALVATFWGIAVANLLILPLADFAKKAAGEDQITRQMIAEIMLMIRQGQDPALVSERLCTYLPPHMRRDLKRGIRLPAAPFQAPPAASPSVELEKTVVDPPVAKPFKKNKAS